MRLLKFLNEVYLDGVKTGGRIMNIYKNPSPTEMRDLRNEVSHGFRFVIDTKNKNFYITDAEYTHSQMFEKSKELQKDINGFKFGTTYFRDGIGLDRILTASTERKNFDEIFSDTLTSDITEDYNDANWQTCYDNLQKLIKQDFSFMSKWIKPDKITELLQQCIDNLESVMTGED